MKTKKQLIVLILMLCTSSISSAQITFQKTFGGISGDAGYDVQQTNDGGYIIAGIERSFSTNFSNVYLIKTDTNGDTLWTKTFGGGGGENGKSVQQTSDGGYIITGVTEFGSGDYDVYLIKTDANGVALWTKTFGGTSYDVGAFVRQTSDGGYIIAGGTSSFGTSGIYLIKIDGNGDSLWIKIFELSDVGFIQQTTEGGYIIGGTTGDYFGTNSVDIILIKTDINGNILWAKTYQGVDEDAGFSGQQTTDGGYIIAGFTKSFGAGGRDVYLVKTDINGGLVWSKTFGGTDSDYCNSVRQTSDGGYILGANTESYGAGGEDFYLIKTDANGAITWTKTFGGTSHDHCSSCQQTADGGYIFVGYTESFGSGDQDVYLIKTDSYGNSGCNQGTTATITGTPAIVVLTPPTIVTSPATLITTPATMVGSGGTVTTLCTSTGIHETITEKSFSIYPNPANDNITFETPTQATIQILNIQGQLIKTITSNDSKISIDVSALPSGMYLVEVKTEAGVAVRKFVKE